MSAFALSRGSKAVVLKTQFLRQFMRGLGSSLPAGSPRNLGPQPFGLGRSPRISRNSLGPFVSRRFRLSCSSTGSDPASPRRRSIACPAISRALAADFLLRFCDGCAPPASACPTSCRIASALVGRGAGCVLIQTSRDFNSSGGMRTLSCFAFASLRLNGIASSLVVRAAFNPSLDRGIHVWRDYISRYCLGLVFTTTMRGLGPFVPDLGSLRPLRFRLARAGRRGFSDPRSFLPLRLARHCPDE